MARRIALYPAGLLLLLIASGAYLRLKNLDFQSLWIDELVTMLTAHPGNTLDQLFTYLKEGNDPHPPFYHLLIHTWFKLGGFNDYGARLPSAIAGILAIPLIFILAREIYNARAGMFAAIFTTFNFYSILYSQEARNYMFAFALSLLSYIFFIRAVKNPGWRASLWYALSTTLLLYTHYYGLLIVLAQTVTVCVFFLTGMRRKPVVIHFGAALTLIFLLYLPWLTNAIALASNTQSFWIKRPLPNFFIEYFNEYFGRDAIVSGIFAFLFIAFLLGGLQHREDQQDKEAYEFSFIVLLVWIAVSYLVPYIRSLVWVPMLFHRYTIVTLPAILIAAAIGLDLFRYRLMKVSFVLIIVAVSLTYLFAFRRYYERPSKQQWREMTQFVIRNAPVNTPILSDRAWHQRYYFEAFDRKPRYVKIEEVNRLSSVWVMTGQLGKPLSKEDQELLENEFKVTQSFDGLDTWAKLFQRKKMHLELNGGKTTGSHRTPLPEKEIRTKKVVLLPGNYTLLIYGHGKKSEGEFPRVRLQKNGNNWKEFTIGTEENYDFSFSIPVQQTVEFSVSQVPMEANSILREGVFIKYMTLLPEEKNIDPLLRLNR